MCMRCGHTTLLNNEDKCPLCGVDFNEVKPEETGRIPNFAKKRKIQKQYEKKYNVTIKEMEKEMVKRNFFEANDIFGNGAPIQLWLPEKDIVIKQHSGLTKGAATLTLGLVGLAATSGVKQESKRKSINTTLQVVDAGVILKKASNDNKDVRIPFENIKSLDRVDNMGRFKLVLLENQTLPFTLKVYINKKQKDELTKYIPEITERLFKTINERAKGNENIDEIKWSSNNSNSVKESYEDNQQDVSLMDELERLGNMYEKGLLTDEEFSAMKMKLINGD